MPYTTLAQSATGRALSKLGCVYSQVKRMQKGIIAVALIGIVAFIVYYVAFMG